MTVKNPHTHTSCQAVGALVSPVLPWSPHFVSATFLVLQGGSKPLAPQSSHGCVVTQVVVAVDGGSGPALDSLGL